MLCKITVNNKNNITILHTDGHQSLHSLLAKNGFTLYAPCGGGGKCGKCKIKVSGTLLPPYGHVADETILACKAYPAGDCEVFLSDATSDYAISDMADAENIGLAIDVGTTGISFLVCDLDTGEDLLLRTFKNAQISFGADIISRLSEDSKTLSNVLVSQINSTISELCPDTSRVKKIAFSANTVMSHYLAGISPDGLSRAPFTPAGTFGETYNATDLGFICENASVYIFPSLAPFVGGDISSGLFSCNAFKKSAECATILIDIGTNGEMALCKGDNIFVASAAAGPAFEGAELSCGMSAEDGAICAYDGKTFKTINNTFPRGIAGSGAIDILASLLHCGAVDAGGRLLLSDEAPAIKENLSMINGEVAFFISENVYLSASDIRKLQLAKAAIRAAITLLLRRSKTDITEIKNVFLAGAFGEAINAKHAAEIGLIPKEFLKIATPVGNASLSGARRLLFSDSSKKLLNEIKASSIHVDLSCDPDFEEEFLNSISM